MSKLESSIAHISQLIMNMQTPLTQAPPSPSHTPISSPSSFSSSSSTPPTSLPSSSKSGVHHVDSLKAKPANAWEGFEFGSISSSFVKHSVDQAVDDLTKHNLRRSYTYNDTSSWPVFPSVKSWDSFQIRCPRTKREFEFTATLDAMVEQAMTALAAGEDVATHLYRMGQLCRVRSDLLRSSALSSWGDALEARGMSRLDHALLCQACGNTGHAARNCRLKSKTKHGTPPPETVGIAYNQVSAPIQHVVAQVPAGNWPGFPTFAPQQTLVSQQPFVPQQLLRHRQVAPVAPSQQVIPQPAVPPTVNQPLMQPPQWSFQPMYVQQNPTVAQQQQQQSQQSRQSSFPHWGNSSN